MLSSNELCVQNLAKISREERYEYRVKAYDDTVRIVKAGSYVNSLGDTVLVINEDAIASIHRNVEIAEIEDFLVTERKDTRFYIFNGDCLDAGIHMKSLGYNPIVLNMANNFKPGGGVEHGAGAQEESLFRRSNYFQHLNKKFYPIKGGIYSPNVVVFKSSEAENYLLYKTPQTISMVAVAAIRRPKLITTESGFKYSDQDRQVMVNKVQIILNAAAKFNHDCVILSAFGCGAFKNPPEEVAGIFKQVLDSPLFFGVFSRVVFAIFNDHNSFHQYSPMGNAEPFARAFNQEIIYDLNSLV
jgi:uncharacterized protein (TIGR02452 family)